MPFWGKFARWFFFETWKILYCSHLAFFISDFLRLLFYDFLLKFAAFFLLISTTIDFSHDFPHANRALMDFRLLWNFHNPLFIHFDFIVQFSLFTFNKNIFFLLFLLLCVWKWKINFFIEFWVFLWNLLTTINWEIFIYGFLRGGTKGRGDIIEYPLRVNWEALWKREEDFVWHFFAFLKALNSFGSW